MKPQGPKNPKSVVRKCRNSAEDADHTQLQKCPLCPTTLSRSLDHQSHITSHAKGKPFKCEHCDFSRTACKQNEQAHAARNHKNTKLQQCPLCPKSFLCAQELKVHIPTHTKEKPYKCVQCDFGTARRQSLQRHVERSHQKSVWETRLKYKCELCPCKFHIPANLRQHMFPYLRIP